MNRISILILCIALQACAVAPKSLLLPAELPPSHNLIGTDSRIRIIANAEQGIFSTTGLVEPKRIICTEPSPDVATTLANSFGVGISVFGQGSASLSTQQVEGLVQLGERTAAIQLLRDKMYQSCLAYANGAISGTSYSLIMSRLDDAIVTLSLGDGAAGAFGRKLAGIGGEADAKVNAALVGLPGEISKIEDQASQLAAATKRVDDAEKALQAHKASEPAGGKEDDYKAQTSKLDSDLASAKGERDALLQLMRSTANSASEASGKIGQLQAGGELAPKPDANVLREMQADFLMTDVNRDFIFACLVELGLREGLEGDEDLQKMTNHLESMFVKKPGATTGGNYAAAILRGRGTALAKFCSTQLPDMIKDATQKFHEYRMYRVKLNADVTAARHAGQFEEARTRDRESLMASIKLCNAEFKDDAARKKACLDQVVPITSIAPVPALSASH